VPEARNSEQFIPNCGFEFDDLLFLISFSCLSQSSQTRSSLDDSPATHYHYLSIIL
jgi:hypothetical protein